MTVVEITSSDDPRLAVYRSLTEAQLRTSGSSGHGILIAESPKVIQTALASGYVPVSLLCERRHITGDAAEIIAQFPDNTPVYTGKREILTSITGYTLTRGVLCAMRRPQMPDASEIIRGKRLICVIDGVCDTTNIGSIFRAAAALDIDAILLTPTSCDPFNRRSIRVSMGTVFRIPWTWLNSPVSSLKELGFTTAALALRENAIALNDLEIAEGEKIAVIFGTEGDGLSDGVIREADKTVIIPMHNGVDSLNVASAAAITFWTLKMKIR